MAQNTYGVTDWNLPINRGGGAGGGEQQKDTWMRLDPGSNELRFITKPHLYLSHKYKADPNNTKDFGDKVYCSYDNDKNCPLCAAGDRPKKRWLVGVIDRKDGTYKILDISVAIYQSIQVYNKKKQYGDPIRYDIDIAVNRQGGATGYYIVTPSIPEALSENDLKIVNGINPDNLVRKCSPPSSDQVLKRLNAIHEKKGLGPFEPKVAPKASARPQAEEDHSPSTDEGGDFTFESAD